MSRLIPALCLLLLSLPVQAACVGTNLIEALGTDERAELSALVGQHPYPEGNLWRAEKPGSTVHVVATVHIPDPRLEEIADRVVPWIEDADILILEASSEMQADIQLRMAETPEIAFLTEGPTLIDLLGDETWGRLSEDLLARNIPPFMAAKFKPWLMAITLAIPTCAIELFGTGETGLDGMLENAALDAGTPITALDNLDTVFGLLGAGPLEEQVEMLRIMLMTEQDHEAALVTALDSYFAGRHRELWEFSRLVTRSGTVDTPDAAFNRFEDTLLVSRNADWERKIPPLVQGRDAVLAVGAAHLSGESGVLRALERLGYSLTPL